MPKCCTKYLPIRQGDFVQIFSAVNAWLLCLGNNRVPTGVPGNHMKTRIYLANNSVTPFDRVVNGLLSSKASGPIPTSKKYATVTLTLIERRLLVESFRLIRPRREVQVRREVPHATCL